MSSHCDCWVALPIQGSAELSGSVGCALGYEPKGKELSPNDFNAVICGESPKISQIHLVLDPTWTLHLLSWAETKNQHEYAPVANAARVINPFLRLHSDFEPTPPAITEQTRIVTE